MDWLAWGGVAAAATMLAAGWRYVLSLWQQLSSRVIVSFDANDVAASSILAYCHRAFRFSRFGPRSYIGWRLFVRPTRRYEAVIAESVGAGVRVFWLGWKPLWIRRIGGKEDPLIGTLGTMYRPVTVSFFRGTFDRDELMIAAASDFNAAFEDNTHSRYYVTHCTGTAGRTIVNERGEYPSASTKVESLCRADFFAHRLLRWELDDLGPDMSETQDSLASLAISEHAQQVVGTVRNWLNSRDWFESRGLPWRYGVLLYGPPGTGKTAFVRAIAETCNLPVYSYDLATFRNDELIRQWQGMRANVPAIALIEDVDSVFVGREPQGDVELTFDCLLNCIDGVERCNGLLLFVTTNRAETLDPALGGTNGSGKMLSRPGRIDSAVEFGPLTAEGRKKLVRRILADWPDFWGKLIDAGDGDTGAQFERRCIDLAQTKLVAKFG